LPQFNNILVATLGYNGSAYSDGYVNNQFAFAFIGDGFD